MVTRKPWFRFKHHLNLSKLKTVQKQKYGDLLNLYRRCLKGFRKLTEFIVSYKNSPKIDAIAIVGVKC